MIRRNDWPERLAGYLTPLIAKPYDAVTHNCCTFVAGAVEAMTGENLLIGEWAELRSEVHVMQLLAQAGGVHNIATECFGEPGIATLARRGDVVSADGVEGETLGICDGHQALIVTPAGLARVELVDCHSAWSIG